MNSGRCLVTGASGAVGPAVLSALQREWSCIRVLSRRPDVIASLFHDVDIVEGDLAIPGVVDAAVSGCDAVVHLAAHLHINRPSADDLERYEAINVTGTQYVINAARAHGVRRVVLASTIAVYGYNGGADVSEATPPDPRTPYGHSKYRAERIVLSARTADGAPLGSVLRLAAVYGARVKGNYRRLLDSLAKGTFVPIGSGSNRRTIVHEQDVAQAVRLVVTHPSAAGRVFNVTDGRCHPLAEIIEAICDALGRRPPRWSVPVGVARTAALLSGLGARLLGKRVSGAAMLAKYLEDVCVSGERARLELDFNPTFDLHRGWRQVVDELRAKGQL